MTRLLVSTVVRGAPLSDGGRLAVLNLAEQRVEKSVPIYPSRPDIADAGSRGNARGGRGIVKVGADRFVVADYHTLRIVGSDLTEVDRVSTRRMAGLHELAYHDGRVLATSTTNGNLLEVDLDSGTEVAVHELRTWPELMADLGLKTSPPAATESDQRVALVNQDLARDKNHLHLNAVAIRDGRRLCFLNRPGAIVDVDERKVVFRHPSLRGGHNLVPYGDDLLVNSSLAGDLVRVPREGSVTPIHLRSAPAVRRRIRGAFVRFHAQRQVGRVVPRLAPSSRPFFLRGLATDGAHAYVGTSPGGIIECDLLSGNVVSLWLFTSNVRESVHGLCLLD